MRRSRRSARSAETGATQGGYKELNARGGQHDAHGFAYVEAEEERASNAAAGYYAWSPRPGLRLISLDTLSEGGIAGPSAQGNLDHPQFRWLEQELQAASRRNELVILFGHHSIGTLVSPVADEAAPPCTGIDDRHDHDVNPGCDADPRSSEPVHRGNDLVELLHRHPHVIAYLAGHTHTNEITPFSRAQGGGFWQIETAAVVDYPMQTRLVEVMDNRDGTLSIFGTMLDIAAPVEPPPSGADAAQLSTEELASIARIVGYNDPQRPSGAGTGERTDRNVELLIDDPRTPGAPQGG